MWCQKPCKRHCELWRGATEERVMLWENCASCIINMDGTLTFTCSADLWKHTSGCSANMSRLYCPLTSAELLIANVTQLQRRASTVDWGSLSLTSWLTAANTPLIYPKTWQTHTHARAHTHTHTGTTVPLSSTVRCTGLPASGRLVNRRSVWSTRAVFTNSFRGQEFSTEGQQILIMRGLKTV